MAAVTMASSSTSLLLSCSAQRQAPTASASGRVSGVGDERRQPCRTAARALCARWRAAAASNLARPVTHA